MSKPCFKKMPVIEKRSETESESEEDEPIKKISSVEIHKNTDKKVFDTLKDATFEIASLPMPIIEKRPILKERLKNDEFLKNYVDKSFLGQMSKLCNDHIKASLIYLYHFSQAYK